MSTNLDCRVAVVRDGAAWFADVRIPAWQLEIHALPVGGASPNEAVDDALRWVGTNLQALHEMVHSLGPGLLNLINPASPTYTPRDQAADTVLKPSWWDAVLGGEATDG